MSDDTILRDLCDLWARKEALFEQAWNRWSDVAMQQVRMVIEMGPDWRPAVGTNGVRRLRRKKGRDMGRKKP